MTIQQHTINSVEDLLEFCADDPIGCTSVHVGHTGAFTCGTNPTALDSLEQWATYPKRITDAANDRTICGRRWIIFVRQDAPPSEMDAWHYSDISDALDQRRRRADRRRDRMGRPTRLDAPPTAPQHPLRRRLVERGLTSSAAAVEVNLCAPDARASSSVDRPVCGPSGSALTCATSLLWPRPGA